jgi:4-amino-4-deoxy-L-arabinose transferase-like glycosyltransferase
VIFGAARLRSDALASSLETHRTLLAVVLCALWMIPGLLGRDPWKPDEAFVLGVVHQMMLSGDFVVPSLAGETFLRFPPFYYVSAAVFGKLFTPLLPLHDAARLVNLAYGAATLGLIAATVARLHGSARGWLAPLLLIGCVGMVQPAHQLVPDNALLTAYALALYGFTVAPGQVLRGGLAVGTAIGLAFLSRGILCALALTATTILLPIVCRPYRTPTAWRWLAVALLAALPWLLVWPALLHARDPALVGEWLSIHEFGRYRFDLPGAGKGTAVYYLKVLPWFAWPVLPFALWALWRGRRALLDQAALAAPALLLLTTLLLLSTSHDKRELLALPMLIPLAVLAAGSLPDLRRGALNAFFWFGIAFFLFFIAAGWVYGVAAEFGLPARLAAHMARMEPGYVARTGAVMLAFAGILTVGWLLALFNIRRSPERPFLVWAVGATAFWGVLTSLMFGYFDHAKSYREMAASLGAALPAERRCVASLALGDSQRALLHYYLGLVTKRIENGVHIDTCDLLLVEGKRNTGTMEGPWQLLWEGHRSGDNRERFRLYRSTVTTGGTPTQGRE